jgi:hypothetical protein
VSKRNLLTGELSDPSDLLDVKTLKVCRTTKSRPHPPLRPKCVGQFVSRARYLFWNATNTVCTCTNVVHMHCRHGGPVTSNATGVAGARSMVDSRQCCKIKSGKSTRLSQCMPRIDVNKPPPRRWNGSTYGLGMGASSSNDDTKGIWAGTAGE